MAKRKSIPESALGRKTHSILNLFFTEPTKEFSFREIAKLAEIGSSSAKKGLEELTSLRLVLADKGRYTHSYKANRENRQFKLAKTYATLVAFEEAVRKIDDSCMPSCIVLFGSAARGEDTEQSDIDLFVQAKAKALSLAKEEKILQRTLHILFEPDIKLISRELLNNLANGIVLSGYLVVK